jgi:hypothetical protein
MSDCSGAVDGSQEGSTQTQEQGVCSVVFLSFLRHPRFTSANRTPPLLLLSRPFPSARSWVHPVVSEEDDETGPLTEDVPERWGVLFPVSEE